MLTLERELENFAGIDDVRVRRALTTTVAGVTVEYTVEFMGTQVCGKMPILQVLDVGINGCSAFVGGTAGLPVVQRDQNSFVTVYQAPTTPAIPFDATNEDVKAALETLSVVSNADVSRQSVTDDVATITVSAPTVGTNTYLSGTFRVGFDGQWTPELPYDVSAVDMYDALVALPTIEGVLVARELTASGGFTWLVTFLQRKYGGDQQKRRRSALATQPPFGYKLEVSGVNLLACTTAELTTCVPKLATTVAARAAVDSKPELQNVVCISNSVLATTGFTLKLLGAETAFIPSNANAQKLKDAITALGVVGDVNVRFRDTTEITVCSASKRRRGRAQLHVGRLPFAYVIDSLTPASTYHGDDTATYDFGRTYAVTFPQTVVVPAANFDVAENAAAATSLVDIPLLYWASSDPACALTQPNKVVVQRSSYGPGLDEKRGQGRIDGSNNECSAAIAAPLARQTINAATAIANALKPEILNLAAKSGIFENYDLAAPALCESCAQKLTALGDLTVTTSLTSVLNPGDYFVLADTPTATSSSSTHRCIMKVTAIVPNTVSVHLTDPGRAACELPATFEAKAWRISRFELRAHTITDLVPGREYAVRVIASSNTYGESPALSTASKITA
ncbi:hypothetical protein BBJ29_002742 [Phytophthora kernoviae]|uniref:Fibronectin type-III domain-containing protein n=1 Tax=Phytophthora kernoviae TaxID=325452 RepID=A0A3F2RPI8_9STRA|nr:hypothetical protein BBJ29_002742 [Phytophthora kernoviae]RLN61739.1 hypothetical protein BBP00_00005211 [Phytophthora kernoviae]